MFGFTGTKVFEPSVQSIGQEHAQTLNNTLCPLQSAGAACGNKVAVRRGRLIHIKTLPFRPIELYKHLEPYRNQYFSAVGNRTAQSPVPS